VQPVATVRSRSSASPLPTRVSRSTRTTAVAADATSSDFDEQSLVEAARHDPDAFAALYRRYVQRIYRFAHRRAGSVAIAEDVTSATFEKALANLGSYRWRPPGIGPWLFRIAANELTDLHRRNQRGERVVRRLQVASTGDVDRGLRDLERLETSAEVRQALDSISARYQQALSLRYLADLTNEEAAAAMGVSRRTMAVVVHRASAALRRQLEPQRSAGATP